MTESMERQGGLWKFCVTMFKSGTSNRENLCGWQNWALEKGSVQAYIDGY